MDTDWRRTQSLISTFLGGTRLSSQGLEAKMVGLCVGSRGFLSWMTLTLAGYKSCPEVASQMAMSGSLEPFLGFGRQ